MKLIIDIPKEIYSDTINDGVLYIDYTYDIEKALKKAIVLEDERTTKNIVFDKIRAEIIEKYWDCDICKYNGHFNIRGDINDILQIIDKYKTEIEPQESEDKG